MQHTVLAVVEQFDFSNITIEIIFSSEMDCNTLSFDIEDYELVDGVHTDDRSIEEMAEEYFYSDAGQAEIIDVYYRDIE